MGSYEKIISIIILLSGVVSCSMNNNSNNSSGNDFYSHSEVGDLYRIPLIKPCEITNTGYIEESWHFKIPFKNSGIEKSQIAVDKVGVDLSDSLILLYSNSIYLPSESQMGSVWFLIDIKSKEETYFIDEEKLKNKMNLIGSDIELKDCEVVYKEFKKTGKVKW